MVVHIKILKKYCVVWLFLGIFSVFTHPLLLAEEATPADKTLLLSAYQGGETLVFEVDWLGLKAGELRMKVEKDPDESELFYFKVEAKTAGLLGVFYPVEDLFRTVVVGKNRVPVRMDVDQNEGARKNIKKTIYDQENYTVSYYKNDEPPRTYDLSGSVHNEFSSFLYLRVLAFHDQKSALVPTFADKKRHEIRVTVESREMFKTEFGEHKTLVLQPHLTFKGQYEKMGDPQIWLTDDVYRIPLQIKAKIVIGSLTARLVEYQGPKGNPVFKKVQDQ